MHTTKQMPGLAGLSLRFIKHLPDWWHRHVQAYVGASQNLPLNSVIISEKLWIHAPNDVMVWRVWNNFATSQEGRSEINQFLALAEGCTRLLDLGASAGMFSALFWKSRTGHREVHSIDSDDTSCRFTEEVRQLDCPKELLNQWTVSHIAVGPENSILEVLCCDFGSIVHIKDGPDNPLYSRDNKSLIDVRTLETYCSDHQFKPDLLKCDIEGYEYETFLGAESFLREHKPRIHLELHNQILKNRGKDPTDLIRMFNSLGYVEMGRPLDLNKCSREICHYFIRHSASS